MFHSLFGTALNMDQFFAYYTITASSHTGWAVIMAHLLNSFICAIFLCIIVERAKKCLDFAFTTHLIHLLFCSMYAVGQVSHGSMSLEDKSHDPDFAD